MVAVDIEINRFALLRDFAFFIPVDMFEGRANKGLCYIPVPQLRRLYHDLWVRLYVELLVGTDVEQMQRAIGSSRSNLRRWSRNLMSKKIAIHEYAGCADPVSRIRIRGRRELTRCIIAFHH